jgi:hypothetical protein
MRRAPRPASLRHAPATAYGRARRAGRTCRRRRRRCRRGGCPRRRPAAGTTARTDRPVVDVAAGPGERCGADLHAERFGHDVARRRLGAGVELALGRERLSGAAAGLCDAVGAALVEGLILLIGHGLRTALRAGAGEDRAQVLDLPGGELGRRRGRFALHDPNPAGALVALRMPGQPCPCSGKLRQALTGPDAIRQAPTLQRIVVP